MYINVANLEIYGQHVFTLHSRGTAEEAGTMRDKTQTDAVLR